jgi:hypothetical protein
MPLRFQSRRGSKLIIKDVFQEMPAQFPELPASARDCKASDFAAAPGTTSLGKKAPVWM